MISASRPPFDNPSHELAMLCVSLRLHRRIRVVIKPLPNQLKDGRSLPRGRQSGVLGEPVISCAITDVVDQRWENPYDQCIRLQIQHSIRF
jgi:hypothetical protein